MFFVWIQEEEKIVTGDGAVAFSVLFRVRFQASGWFELR